VFHNGLDALGFTEAASHYNSLPPAKTLLFSVEKASPNEDNEAPQHGQEIR
jgi:hypothetical protein